MSNLTRSITPPSESEKELPIMRHFKSFRKNKKRHGHDQDIFDENDIRQVAGCLPIDSKTGRVLLISSSKNENAWVLPKGGWEQDETKEHAALRETWEEAGIKGYITKDLGVFEERAPKKKTLKAHHWVFEMEIEDVASKFPEVKKRERKWFTFEEAILATQDHKYIQEAILKSSLNPNKDSPALEPAFVLPTTATKKSSAKLKPIVNPDAVNSPKLAKTTLADTAGSPPTTPRGSVESGTAAANRVTPLTAKQEAPMKKNNLEQPSSSANQVQPIDNSTTAATFKTEPVDATTKNLASMSVGAEKSSPKPSPKLFKEAIVKSIKSIFQKP